MTVDLFEFKYGAQVKYNNKNNNMVYKFGNLELIIEHVFAISEPEYDYDKLDNKTWFVTIYNINGLFVRSKFYINEQTEMSVKPNPDNLTKSVKHSINLMGLVLKNGEIEWSEGVFYGGSFSKIKESLFYNRVMDEIEKLKQFIEKKVSVNK